MALTHLSHALLALIDRRNTTATALGSEVGLHQVTVSRACAGERLSVDSLRALCTHQPDSRDGLELLLAHLRDEVERAGRLQTEVSITAEGKDATSDIRLLEEQARTDPELNAILHDLAQLVRNIRRKYPVQLADAPLAAEDQAIPTKTPLTNIIEQEAVKRETRDRQSRKDSSSKSSSA
jgi:hypothetical protein